MIKKKLLPSLKYLNVTMFVYIQTELTCSFKTLKQTEKQPDHFVIDKSNYKCIIQQQLQSL